MICPLSFIVFPFVLYISAQFVENFNNVGYYFEYPKEKEKFIEWCMKEYNLKIISDTKDIIIAENLNTYIKEKNDNDYIYNLCCCDL